MVIMDLIFKSLNAKLVNGVISPILKSKKNVKWRGMQ